jgi:hypothetical protein
MKTEIMILEFDDGLCGVANVAIDDEGRPTDYLGRPLERDGETTVVWWLGINEPVPAERWIDPVRGGDWAYLRPRQGDAT